MKITKIQALSTQQQKVKARALSNSQQKTKSTLLKKKNINLPLPLNTLNEPLLITKPLKLLPNQNSNLSIEPQAKNNLFFNNNILNNDFRQALILSPENLPGKSIQTNNLNQKDQRQIFLQYIQSQLRNQKQQEKIGSMNKVKLPQINKSNKNFSQQSQQLINNRQTILKYTLPLQTSINNSIYEKNNNSLQSTIKQTGQIRKSSKETAGTFINIKTVIPKQKISTYKKKDHSLRDLRILKKQREQQIIDQVMQELNYSHKNASEDNSKLKSNTALLKRNKASQCSSPLRLTADKKRSHLDSGQKLQKYPYNNNVRQKKSFSISQKHKKKYAINYMDFCLFLSALNNIKIFNSSLVSYKAFVGKGNNSILVKNAIKNRFWWNIASQKNDSDINFLWQQSKCPIFLGSLSSTIQQSQQISKQALSQKQLQAKKQKYYLQSKNDQKVNENIKQFVQGGFLRLLSVNQVKQSFASPYYAQLNNTQILPLHRTIDANKARIHNHLQFNVHLTNKKALFYNLKSYYQLINDDPFKYIPLTFHIKQHGDQSWNQFKQVYEQKLKQQSIVRGDFNKKKKKQKSSNPLWIIKPGENTNRGCGIQVSDSLQQIAQMVRTKTANGKNRSSIVQRYLMPFLYQKRKFDIRCYMLATSIKNTIKGYWYEQGYIRTSCKQFTTKNLKNRMIHLTNDAVQKKSQDYGKYENGNKVSFADFQRYLDNNYPDKKYNFFKQCYPQMMKLAKDTLSSTYQVLDCNHKQFTFQVFGLDFMIDQDFNTWLIQVNNNPCLQLSSPLLARIIPNMIQNAFKIALDPIFPPPLLIPRTKTLPTDLFQSNKFTLIFNSSDVQQKVQHFMSENKINLSKIIQGEDQQEEELADQDQQGCENINNGQINKGKQNTKNGFQTQSTQLEKNKTQSSNNSIRGN